MSETEYIITYFDDFFHFYDFKNNVFKEIKTEGIPETLKYRIKFGDVLMLIWGEGLFNYNIQTEQINKLCS